MADKRISQLVERVDIANNDVVPIVASGATTTNKATISSIQTFMQENLDVGVTSVGITIGTSGTDVNVTGSPVTTSGNITINIPTASATNRGLLSAADWVTFNSKQDAGSFVTLDTAQTITAQKTFTTSGSSDTMIISHGSGSGFALDVLKAGNNEALRVTKTSGSGNAMTVIGGNFEAPTIVKTGGTSSQFLKADGSVDSSTYLTTGSATSTYVPYSGAAASVNLGVYSITANAINSAGSGSTAGQINLRSDAFFSLVNGYGSIASGTTNQFNLYQTTGAGVFRGAILSLNSITESATRTYTLPNADGTLALSTDLGAYLPLTGGTLTGALNGTSASFTGAGSFISTANTYAGGALILRQLGGTNPIYLTSVGGSFALSNGGSADHFLIASTGAATFSGALNGTSASFTGKLSVTQASTDFVAEITNTQNANPYGLRIKDASSGANGYPLLSVSNNAGSVEYFRVNSGTGAATFSSSVTSVGGIINGSDFRYNPSGNTNGNPVLVLKNPSSGVLSIASEIIGNAFVNSNSLALSVSNTTSGRFNALTIANTGNVGIGTATPGTYDAAKIGTSHKFLNVQSSSSAYAVATLAGNQSSADNRIGYLTFVNDNNSSSYKYSAWLGSEVEGSTANQQGGRLIFSTSGDASSAGPIERLRITSGGNVQIGNDSNPFLYIANGGSTDVTSGINWLYGGGLVNGGGIEMAAPSGNNFYMIFKTRNSGSTAERMRLTSDAYLRMASGSGGIQFNGDTAAANALDDYEEGTFTPVIEGSSTVGTGTYIRQQGTYTKIGNLVTCNVWLQWSAHSGTGDMVLAGFPFTSIGTTNYRASGTFGWVENLTLTANNVATIAMSPSQTKASITQYPVGGGAASSVAMDTAANLHYAITYQTV